MSSATLVFKHVEATWKVHINLVFV